MKKILLFVVALMSATMMQAGLGLSVEGNLIERDTTITVTEMEEDEFTRELVMGWKGMMFYSGQLTVELTRSSVDLQDNLCVTECTPGNGQLTQTMPFNVNKLPATVEAHYYPVLGSKETIAYHFVGGEDAVTLTVIFDASATPVPSVSAPMKSMKTIRNGQIIIVRDGVEYNALGSKL